MLFCTFLLCQRRVAVGRMEWERALLSTPYPPETNRVFVLCLFEFAGGQRSPPCVVFWVWSGVSCEFLFSLFSFLSCSPQGGQGRYIVWRLLLGIRRYGTTTVAGRMDVATY